MALNLLHFQFRWNISQIFGTWQPRAMQDTQKHYNFSSLIFPQITMFNYSIQIFLLNFGHSNYIVQFSLFNFIPSIFGKSGVDFIKVGPMAQIIEIALSICALRLRPTFWDAFHWRESWAQGRRAQKQFMKLTHDVYFNKITGAAQPIHSSFLHNFDVKKHIKFGCK